MIVVTLDGTTVFASTDEQDRALTWVLAQQNPPITMDQFLLNLIVTSVRPMVDKYIAARDAAVKAAYDAADPATKQRIRDAAGVKL